jgi:hypothetical protein
MPWYENPSWWAAIGSLSAMLIALVALYLSYRGQAGQQLRQKREEMRGVLERLISLREEQNALSKEHDEMVKAVAGTYQNSKREIYLDAAESLERQIGDDLSASEYSVLAFENQWESDFVAAKKYFEKGVKRSKYSSAPKQSELLRGLAAIYFMEDPALRNIDKGRQTYEKAVLVFGDRTDDYSNYIRALGYRTWAASERGVKNLNRAGDLLGHAYEEWMKIPSQSALLWINDLRNMAYDWGYLAIAYFQARDEDASYVGNGRWAFREAQKVLDTLSDRYGIGDDYTIDAQGLIFHWWGQQEVAAGSRDEGQQLLVQAEQAFQRLSASYALKNLRLAELRQAQSQIARGEEPTHPSTQEVRDDVTSYSGLQ